MKTLAFCLLLAAAPVSIFSQNQTMRDSNDLRIVVAAGLTPVAPYGQHEFILFNALSTYQFSVETPAGELDAFRVSRLNHTLQWMYGVSRSNRLAAGLEARFAHLRLDGDETASPFRVLSGDVPANGYAVHTLSAIGPRVRFTPFARHYEFTLQGSLLFPTGKREYRTQLDEDRLRIALQASYITPLPARFYVYGGVELQSQPANDTRKQTTWSTPLNLYVFNKIVDRGPQQVLLFANLGYVSALEKAFKGGLRQVSAATYWGAGAQWIISPAWSVSASWQGLLGVDEQTNLDKRTYAAFGLGARYAGMLGK